MTVKNSRVGCYLLCSRILVQYEYYFNGVPDEHHSQVATCNL